MSLEEILKQVEKPGRYLGDEWNEIKKDPGQVKVKVALVFPDLYEIGMSYLGQKILYSILNNHQSVLAERVYAPWVDFEQKLRAQKRPLFSLENKIPLYEFDILGFSLLYELNYSNVLTILDLGQIPLFSAERDLRFPLIIGGGPAAFNPEPIAQVFDLFLTGDGEDAFIEIIEKFMLLKEEFKDKERILKELARVKGVYVPCLYETYQPPESFLFAVRPINNAPAKIEKRIFFDFHKTSFPENIVVPNIQAVFDRVAVEVARGCPQKCRFCQASSLYFPYRVKNPSLVIQNIINSLNSTGYENASLTSLSISDYPYLVEVVESLMKELKDRKISLSLSSLRPKGLSSEVARNIIKVRKTGFTLVPEAGTERLRRVINKNLKDDEVWNASLNAFSQGWRLLKLYFMVGLPTEKDDDLEGIILMVKEIIKIGSAILKSFPRINLSVSSFIPKPHTPFQWLKMEDEKILQEKHRFLKSHLKKYPFVRFKNHSLKSSLLECVFSRGDRRLAKPLVEAWKGGARFDSWKDKLNFHRWEEIFESERIDYHLYLASIPQGAVLPWDHIDCGLKKSHLLQELTRAMKGESTPSCLDNKCSLCQGCSIWSRQEKEFKKEIKTEPKKIRDFGEKTEDLFCYRAFYSKLYRARFLSHLDLTNLIQRALRRSGIPIIYSEGFHPKMRISYLPALPLGMEGRNEVLEFKSKYYFSEEEFIRQVNKFLPSGIKFTGMRRIELSEPSLNKDIRKMIYSLNLKNQEVIDAVKRLEIKRNIPSSDSYEIIQRLFEEFIAKNKDETIVDIFLDRKEGKLYIIMKFSLQKGVRPQEIVEGILEIENSVFYMAREEILFKLTRERDSYIKILEI